MIKWKTRRIKTPWRLEDAPEICIMSCKRLKKGVKRLEILLTRSQRKQLQDFLTRPPKVLWSWTLLRATYSRKR